MAQTILDLILKDVRAEVDAARAARPPSEIRSMLADAQPVRPMAESLSSGFGLIAEIKKKSPSVGAMREQNVNDAASAYEESGIVRALSILTNHTHFGGDIAFLQSIRTTVGKPVLRKDFFIEEYQIREARAFGADAVLLMANVLDAPQLKGFFELAGELGMDALFEVHTEEEISMLPEGAKIIGINSRKFRATGGFAGADGHASRDFSVHMDTFELVEKLPANCLRVAESGLDAGNVRAVADRFHAALVGTSLLRDERGIRAGLEEFRLALAGTGE
jgi:indole-3-glycerol phosphate synthase